MQTQLWILESLRPDDAKTGRRLRDAVLDRDPLSKNGIRVHFRAPENRKEFLSCLEEIFVAANEGGYPVLHIEAHGGEDCLQLSNDEIIKWDELSVPMVKINDRLKGNLLVTVAACSGAHMAQTVLSSMRAPFLALVGPGTTLLDSELLKDYTEFYFEFDKTRSLTKARWALNAFRTAENNYYCSTARDSFVQIYGSRMSLNLSVEEQNRRIEELVTRLTSSDSTCDTDTARAAASKIIGDPKEFVRRAWEQFVFIDRYPENVELFPFPFDEQ